MKEKEYLDLLRYYLRKFPDNVVDDIIADYEEHFRLGKEQGKSEGLISAELGSPLEIAKDFKAGDYNFSEEREEKPRRSGLFIFLAILGILALSPLLLTFFGVLVAGLAVAFSMVVVVFAFGYALLSSFLGFSIFGGSVSPIYLHPLTKFFGSLTTIGLGLILAVAFFYLLKYLWIGIKKLFLAIVWEFKKWRAKK